MNDKLKIKIGSNPNDLFKITLGDEDITERLCVRSLKVYADAKDLTMVTLVCYADEVEIEASIPNVTINNLDRAPNKEVKE